MLPNGSFENSGSPISNWHSIRPWAPSLSLNVREITSVSATFILSSSLSGEIDSSLASIGLEAAEEGPEGAQSVESRKTNSIIADALAKGVSVNVNGSAWPRAFIRIDDQLDEAVIIIYALMPGRQYDIELGLAPIGQPSSSIRRQVTTEDDSDPDNAEVQTDPESPGVENSISSSDPNSTPSTSPSRTVPGTPPPQITLEDRLNQLQLTLSASNSERDSLMTSLKSARKDAQKADSALRAEIETLKRTSERNSAAELRGRQKVLALQEAVKRAQNSTKETEDIAEELKKLEPELNAMKEQKEAEHTKIKQEADRVRKQREDVEEKERKRLEAMRIELAGLTAKLEKLGGKREKLETIVIPDLEERLKDVVNEIDLEEQGISRLEMDDTSASYAHLQRYRQYSGEETQAGRPALAPIQRPPHADHSTSMPNHTISHSTSAPLWTPGQSNRQPPAPKHGQTHNARSHSLTTNGNQTGPILLLNPQRGGSLKSNALPSSCNISNLSTPSSTSLTSISGMSSTTTSSPTSSPTRTSSSVPSTTSTLSSRAPAFEPSRSIGTIKGANCNFLVGTTPNSAATASGFSTATAAIQRPSAAVTSTTRLNPTSGAKNGSHGNTNWLTMHGHHS